MNEQPKKKFHKTASELHQAVGSALAQWSQIERALNLILFNLAGLKSYAIAEAIMASMVSFRGRLEIIDNILIVDPRAPEVLSEWTNLRKRVLKRSKERNNLAHFTLVFHGSNAPGDGYAVAPMFNPHLSAIQRDTLLYNASEIAQIEQRFLQLAGEMQEFSTHTRQQ
jgi:hypothetical protein